MAEILPSARVDDCQIEIVDDLRHLPLAVDQPRRVGGACFDKGSIIERDIGLPIETGVIDNSVRVRVVQPHCPRPNLAEFMATVPHDRTRYPHFDGIVSAQINEAEGVFYLDGSAGPSFELGQLYRKGRKATVALVAQDCLGKANLYRAAEIDDAKLIAGANIRIAEAALSKAEAERIGMSARVDPAPGLSRSDAGKHKAP